MALKKLRPGCRFCLQMGHAFRTRILLRDLINGGVKPGDRRFADVNYMRRMRTLNRMALGLLSACPLTGLLFLLTGSDASLVPILVVALAGLVVCVGVRRGLPLELGTHLLVGAIMILVAVRQAEFGGLDMVGQAWIYVSPIVAGLMLGARGAAVYTGLLSLQIAGFAWLESQGVRFPVPVPAASIIPYTAGVQIMCGWAFFFLMYAFLAAQSSAERKLLLLNRRLEHSRDRARRATRAKSQFLANVSHEIRTPMNIIFGMTEIVEADGQLSDEQRECLQRTRTAASTLLALVDDVLDLSRVEAGKLELAVVETSLHALLAEVADLLRPRAEAKGLALTCRVDPAIPRQVLADPVRLRQIVTNLVGNAVKFTDRGSVAIDARLMVETPLGATILIAVEDTGIGIPPDRHAAIFESFTQADGSSTRRYGGTGLGLTICRDLVKLMGGALELHSAPGEGSEFRVVLFLAKPAGVRRPAEITSGQERPLARAAG
jgi:signal transduction histidine kinase